jgi:pimeloyl-ACP methyl ester carboxylesterase
MQQPDFDLQLPGGRVRARRWGDERDPLVVCVHGLTANLTAFSWLAEGLVRQGRQVIAIDCRGRGRSEVTAPGSYGLAAHARDVVELARTLGAARFDYVGWSMGALIGMSVAEAAPDALDRLVLLDLVGPVDPEAITLVEASLDRLDAVVPTPDAYVEAIRSRGVVEPWTPFWTAHYTYELARRDDGSWTPSTDRSACAEDLAGIRDDHSSRWRALTMPTTLVRATTPIAGALLVSDAALDAFTAAVPAATVVETPTNHYTVMTDPRMLAAVTETLA